MGCFNLRCAISNLPVTYGDKAAFFFGKAVDPTKDNWGGYAGPPHFFRLTTTPVIGVYNDYGWFEKEDKKSLKIATKINSLFGLPKLDESDYDVRKTITVVHYDIWEKFVEAGNRSKKIVYQHEIKQYKPELQELFFTIASNFEGDYIASVQERFEFSLRVLESYDASKFYELTKKYPDLAEVISYIYREGCTATYIIEQHKNHPGYTALLTALIDAIKPLDRSVRSAVEWTFGFWDFIYSNMGNSPTLDQREQLDKLLKLVRKDKDVYEAIRNVNSFYLALIWNNLVMPGQDNLATTSQDVTLWGHSIVNNFTSKYISQRVKKHHTSDVSLEKAMEDEINSIYG